MSTIELQAAIEAAYEQRAELTPRSTPPATRLAIEGVMDLLDAGTLRVADKRNGEWRVHEWLKKAVLLSFRIAPNAPLAAGPLAFYDKVPLKYAAATRRDSCRPACASCRPRPCAGAPMSRPMSCSCRATSTSAPTSIPARWSTPGRRSGPAPRSAATCTCPAASASAACSSRCRPPDHHRGRLLHRRALRDRRGRDRRAPAR